MDPSGDYNSYYDPSQQHQQYQQQQAQHQEMYDPNYGGAASYYPGSQQGSPEAAYYPQQDQQYGDWSSTMQQQQDGNLLAAPPPPVEIREPGCYYPTGAFQTHVLGDPITAIAYDDLHAAMYISSASTSLVTGGRQRWNDHRASMLVTHSTVDGMLYSSVAGHPEAKARVLNSIYRAVYGSGTTTTTSSAAASPNRHRPVPNHAYRPPYRDPKTSAYIVGGSQKSFEMGIGTLIPVKAGLGQQQGYVASVSPSAVRLHAHGGMQLADKCIEGMICGTAHPSGANELTTHMTVGGLVLRDEDMAPSSGYNRPNRHNLVCVDLWEGMRTVASSPLDRRADVGTGVAVTALATNHNKGSLVAGCSDGQVRLFDGRLRNIGQIKSHAGGVVDVAVSDDGTLFATTGYGSRTARAAGSPLYGFPDPTVLVYDMRYLGRGGIPHPFAGLRGGPRFLSFVPDVEGKASNRLMVASGQKGGGLQILHTLSTDAPEDASNFIVPQLDQDYSITAMCISEDNLAVGTSQGEVLRYDLEGYSSNSVVNKGGIFVPRSTGTQTDKKNAPARRKKELEMPPSFEPPPPALSIEASLLRREDPNSRKPIFSSYIFCRDPTVSQTGNASAFGHLAESAMVAPSLLRVSGNLLDKATHAVDYLHTIPVSELDVNLLEDHRPDHIKSRRRSEQPLKPNPNKLLYTNKLFPYAYEESLNRSKKLGRKNRGRSGGQDPGDETDSMPNRYRLTIRPAHKSSAVFTHGEMNETGFIPGWDYPPSMPNAFIPPILMLLYLIPEMKSVIANGTVEKAPPQSARERSLLPDLGFVFHRIDSISRNALLFPGSVGSSILARVGAWAPSNFISCLKAMPEAEQLQILDGSPAAVDSPRRPEAFYRFLLHQIDKETKKSLDPLGAMDFVSINEFLTGSEPLSKSITRVHTIDLVYESFFPEGNDAPAEARFGDVLQRTLCKEVRLRAWSPGSKAYETIVQRKIATSLPSLLSLSCACAGRKDEEGLKLWRGTTGDNGVWLPEFIEVELGDTGSVIVREFISVGDSGEGDWIEIAGHELPQSVSDIVVANATNTGSSIRKRRYRLEAVLSTVRDDMDRNSSELLELSEDSPSGHNVLHIRVDKEYKKHVTVLQIQELENYLAASCSGGVSNFTLMGNPNDENLQKRLELAKEKLRELEKSEGDEWVLLNGYVVSETVIEDARAFHNKFKEPSLVVYRSTDQDTTTTARTESPKLSCKSVPPEVMKTLSLTNGTKSPLAENQRPSNLPGRGDLIAFDAEFVSVQEEESALTEAGSKVVLRETRYAVGRISVINCRTQSVILDDYCLPREPPVDYLTRFSGIVAKDLDPKQSPHHLIGARAAYLKLRYLMERGCIFVGHGLKQDFWTLNLAVPAHQIIDTVEIYRKPAQRYISLRFLTNFVLKRDMQQSVHDSVEDARAAYELYCKAIELKKNGGGEFDKLLDELYAYGQKNDWKLGVDED